MAITPPSDIVLDVARAADPVAYREAVERLSRLRATTASTEPFTVPGLQVPRADPANIAGPATTTAGRIDAGAGAQPRRRLDAYGQFESFVLQSFIQSMLPKNAANVFGKGSAGEFWKSMLAEKMGDELARSGQVGIARHLSAGPTHPVQPIASSADSALTVPPSLQSTLTDIQPRTPDRDVLAGGSAAPDPIVSERS